MEDAPASFKDALQQQEQPELSAKKIPSSVAPSGKKEEKAVIDHRPMGLSANQFGFLTFCLFTFATLLVLFSIRQPLVQRAPVLAPLYNALGMGVKAPGEGLRISELVAENRIDNETRKLAVNAKIENISGQEMEYPPLLITVSGPYGSALKEWTYQPEEKIILKAGESAPLKLEFGSPPEDGAKVTVQVLEK